MPEQATVSIVHEGKIDIVAEAGFPLTDTITPRKETHQIRHMPSLRDSVCQLLRSITAVRRPLVWGLPQVSHTSSAVGTHYIREGTPFPHKLIGTPARSLRICQHRCARLPLQTRDAPTIGQRMKFEVGKSALAMGLIVSSYEPTDSGVITKHSLSSRTD